MVTLLITAVAVLVLFGIGIYFWQRPAQDNVPKVLPPPPNPRGLFAESAKEIDEAERLAKVSRRREELLKQAGSGQLSSLDEAHLAGDSDLYDRVVAELIQFSNSNPKLLALLSHVSRNDLPVNRNLAETAVASWSMAPDRNGTAKALHFAALSDDADIYRGAVETALQLWREAKLGDISTVELRALFDGEFWLLSSRSRSSGAGFILKRTLEGARRELEAAGANQ